MSVTIESDAQGRLVLSAGMAPPLTKYRLEPHGDELILRREPSQAEERWSATAPKARVTWLREWIGSLAPGTPLAREATRCEAMYD